MALTGYANSDSESPATFAFDVVQLSGFSRLLLNGPLTPDGYSQPDTLTIKANSLSLQDLSKINTTSVVSIEVAGNATIGWGTGIDASYGGYFADQGPSTIDPYNTYANYGGGGGHGGSGGETQWGTASGFVMYGDMRQPTTMGSGGWSASGGG